MEYCSGDIEAKTGQKVNKEQIHLIKEALRTKNYEKLTPKETAKHRSIFTSSLKDKLIAEWEEKPNKNGQDTQKKCLIRMEKLLGESFNRMKPIYHREQLWYPS
ncbi:hypothetical protein [Cytobacillus stercorigallinarum]|uniref:hypothetical protein n=1 Tax=Cytobacillus stercorigallinarum TaxID=2762240 RepID=UPI001CD8E7DE|nr:hypothetical protein [Cytobacillus stercorigallinarum]